MLPYPETTQQGNRAINSQKSASKMVVTVILDNGRHRYQCKGHHHPLLKEFFPSMTQAAHNPVQSLDK